MSAQQPGITRSISLSSSLHFGSLADFTEANAGAPKLAGQNAIGLDNGYGLQGNPTCHELQNAILRLEHGGFSLLYPSGLTALSALGGFLQAGDHWLLPAGAYAPLQRYARYLQQRCNISYSLYDPLDPANLEQAITPQTKLIHIESPCSVIFETIAITEVAAIAHKRNILVSTDNTWASGILCSPLDLGADISILSLTKYIAGYSDVFMGSITTQDQGLFEQIAYHHRVYGYTVSPFSAMLVQRGLESLPVRIAAHAQNAAQLIEVMKASSTVAHIFSAGPHTSAELSGSNGLFSVELYRKFSDEELEDILSGLGVFAIGESWGGTKSLVLPFQPESLADHAKPPTGTILRFHAGLENIEEQIKDIHTIIQRLS